MKIDILVIQIAILFIPGLIWAQIDSRYALISKPSDTEFFVRAFLFGVVSYCATFGFYKIFRWDFVIVDFANADKKEVVTYSIIKEVLWAIATSLVLSVIWIYAATYKLFNRFLRFIRATKKFGDEDVWDYTFNSRYGSVDYVHFRDFSNKIVYAGWVDAFSETEKLRELTLRDVQIFDFDGEKLFEVPRVYLAREAGNIHIEFPQRPPEEALNGDEQHDQE